jgi:hypothetical protein
VVCNLSRSTSAFSTDQQTPLYSSIRFNRRTLRPSCVRRRNRSHEDGCGSTIDLVCVASRHQSRLVLRLHQHTFSPSRSQILSTRSLAYSPASMLQQYGDAAVSIAAVLQPSSLVNLKAPVLLAPTGVAVIPASLQASAVAFPFDTATSIRRNRFTTCSG